MSAQKTVRVEPEVRERAYLSFLDGKTYTEISELIGVSLSSVKRLAKEDGWGERKILDSGRLERRVEAILKNLDTPDLAPDLRADLLITITQICKAAKAIDEGTVVSKTPGQVVALVKHLSELANDDRFRRVAAQQRVHVNRGRQVFDVSTAEPVRVTPPVPSIPVPRPIDNCSGMIGKVLGRREGG